MSSNRSPIHNWKWKKFSELTATELYELLALRSEVFIVEQDCPYQDVDGVDVKSQHLLGYLSDGTLAAYLRVPEAGVKYSERSIGRVVTSPKVRRQGVGRLLMAEALKYLSKEAIRISAQEYLREYYQSYGFQVVHGPYDEDGIPHLEMLKPAD